MGTAPPLGLSLISTRGFSPLVFFLGSKKRSPSKNGYRPTPSPVELKPGIPRFVVPRVGNIPPSSTTFGGRGFPPYPEGFNLHNVSSTPGGVNSIQSVTFVWKTSQSTPLGGSARR